MGPSATAAGVGFLKAGRPRAILAGLAQVAVVGTLLVPIWGFAQFPSEDGPSHVENARILLRLLRGDGELAVFYQLNLDPFPNWFSHASLAALLTAFGPAAAEKLLLTAYVVLFPLSFRYALASIRPSAASLFWLVTPFVYNQHLHLGFYNRAFAVIPFFFVLGYWVRRRGRLALAQTAAFGALLLWLYFCAAMSLILAGLGIALLAVGFTVSELVHGAPDRWLALRDRSLALAGAGALPVVLLLRFRIQQGGATGGPGLGLAQRGWELARLYDLASYDPRELWLSTALGVILGIGLLAAFFVRLKRPGWCFEDGLLATACLYTAVYLTAPTVHVQGVGPEGGWSHDRVSLHVCLAFLLWLGAQPLAPRARRLLLVSAVATALALVAIRVPRYAELNDQLAEYGSAGPHMPIGATVLALSFTHHGVGDDGRALAWRVEPFRHAASRLAASRGLLNVDNYQADVLYFPVIFRPRANPYPLLGASLDRMPACVHIGRFNRLAVRPIDFVLLWGTGQADENDPCVAATLRQVTEGYRLVYVSPQRRRVELFKRLGL
jgi:hypothetical protein